MKIQPRHDSPQPPVRANQPAQSNLITVISRRVSCRGYAPDPVPQEHLVLAATELGLGTCWIGWIKPSVIARLVGWPRLIKPAVVITVGYPREGESSAPLLHRRKALDEIVQWL